MGQTNTTANMSPDDVAYYDKTLLANAFALQIHTLFGDVRPLPTGQDTMTIKFERDEILPLATTPIVESVTPVSEKMTPTWISCELKQYGSYQKVSDVLSWTSRDNKLNRVSMAQGEQAGRSLDVICRDVIVAGTNVIYPSTHDERTDITSSDKLSTALLDEAIVNLRSRNAKPITAMVNPDEGYATTPLNEAYIGVNSTDIDMSALTEAAGWKPVEKYARNTAIIKGEVGAYKQIRFTQTSLGKVWVDGGNGSTVDVYATLILGRNAYGISQLAGHAMEMIINPVGSGGTENPLALYGTSAWKATFGAVILNDDFMVRIEHALL